MFEKMMAGTTTSNNVCFEACRCLCNHYGSTAKRLQSSLQTTVKQRCPQGSVAARTVGECRSGDGICRASLPKRSSSSNRPQGLLNSIFRFPCLCLRCMFLMLRCAQAPNDRFGMWILTPCDRTMDTELDGFERKIGQVLGLRQTRLDKHDAELESVVGRSQNGSLSAQEKQLRHWQDELRHFQ